MYFLKKKLTINNVIGKLGSCVMIFYLKEQKKHNNLLVMKHMVCLNVQHNLF